MQTILGAGGVIGRGLATELRKYADKIRLVSRNPYKIDPDNELFKADLTNKNLVSEAVKGSEVAYLTVGLKYDLNVWQEQWPVIMHNVIEACKEHKSKLVFFDNVYAYGHVKGKMTEETPINPSSKKGEVRARIASMLLDEVRKGNINAIVARAADFYGPESPLSLVTVTVFDKLANNKSAMWMLNDKVRHSFTFTPDAVKGTALLGNTEKAYNKVWHLPTHNDALTGKEFIEMAAEAFNTKPKYAVVSDFMVKVISLFKKPLRENIEMDYQNKYDYLFDSTKFNETFNYEPVSYPEGIKLTTDSYKQK